MTKKTRDSSVIQDKTNKNTPTQNKKKSSQHETPSEYVPQVIVSNRFNALSTGPEPPRSAVIRNDATMKHSDNSTSSAKSTDSRPGTLPNVLFSDVTKAKTINGSASYDLKQQHTNS